MQLPFPMLKQSQLSTSLLCQLPGEIGKVLQNGSAKRELLRRQITWTYTSPYISLPGQLLVIDIVINDEIYQLSSAHIILKVGRLGIQGYLQLLKLYVIVYKIFHLAALYCASMKSEDRSKENSNTVKNAAISPATVRAFSQPFLIKYFKLQPQI